MRSWLRTQFFQLLRRAFATEDGLDILHGALPDLRPSPPALTPISESPYDDVEFGSPPRSERPCLFVTGRFRSGSTLLWNIFRRTPGVTAYYEPLNERRWFDPAMRGDHTDASHKNVADYWREYDGLAKLGELYDEDWIRRRLYLAEDAWLPRLAQYIQALIDAADGWPVLQFNRVDFRLPWLQASFPSAKILHLFRHPRDQWMSILRREPRFPRSGTIADFAQYDEFYLLSWCHDLKHAFPFLDPAHAQHPYELHYLVWRLSYQFGKTYAHHSLAFEHLIEEPRQELKQTFEQLEIDRPVTDAMLSIMERPEFGKWHTYADESWFAEKEARCERLIAQYFQTQLTSDQPTALS